MAQRPATPASRISLASRIIQHVDRAAEVLLDPSHREAYDRLLSESPAKDGELTEPDLEQTEDLIERGWDLLMSGRTGDTLLVARKALNHDEADPDAWILSAEAKSRWGDLQEAIDDYSRAVQLLPNEASYYFELGTYYEAAEHKQKALEHWRSRQRAALRTLLVRS